MDTSRLVYSRLVDHYDPQLYDLLFDIYFELFLDDYMIHDYKIFSDYIYPPANKTTEVCVAISLIEIFGLDWFYIPCRVPMSQAYFICEVPMVHFTTRQMTRRADKECQIRFIFINKWCIQFSDSKRKRKLFSKVPRALLLHDMLHIYLTGWTEYGTHLICINCQLEECQCLLESMAIKLQLIRHWTISEEDANSEYTLTVKRAKTISCEPKNNELSCHFDKGISNHIEYVVNPL